jgi:hypothetical protein
VNRPTPKGLTPFRVRVAEQTGAPPRQTAPQTQTGVQIARWTAATRGHIRRPVIEPGDVGPCVSGDVGPATEGIGRGGGRKWYGGEDRRTLDPNRYLRHAGRDWATMLDVESEIRIAFGGGGEEDDER